MNKIAVLLTCHNRKEKTINCLASLYKSLESISKTETSIYLVDDGSTDGTAKAISQTYPEINILNGDGNLFWAGGMRMAWTTALKGNYDGYLLLNDDTVLNIDAVNDLLKTHEYCLSKFKNSGIYVGSTSIPNQDKLTYGGYLLNNFWSNKSAQVIPNGLNPQVCDFANANILLVTATVVNEIGILSERYTHSLADWDYTLTARKHKIPILIATNYCGTCINDHPKSWLSSAYPLKERIKYLKNPKYLAYNEFLFYIKRHFPLTLPSSFVKLWLKTLFPIVWDKFKKQDFQIKAIND